MERGKQADFFGNAQPTKKTKIKLSTMWKLSVIPQSLSAVPNWWSAVPGWWSTIPNWWSTIPNWCLVAFSTPRKPAGATTGELKAMVCSTKLIVFKTELMVHNTKLMVHSTKLMVHSTKLMILRPKGPKGDPGSDPRKIIERFYYK